MLDLGPVEQNIAKQAVRAGQPLPDRIQNAPELRIGLDFYMQAFFELDYERTHIFSPTPIPRRSIREYAFDLELDETQTEDLFFFIRKMDNEHLKRLSEKMK